MTLFQNLILSTNHYGNSQEMLEMSSFLKYIDLWVGPVLRGTFCISASEPTISDVFMTFVLRA
jgi:hypothetical protein